MVHNCGYELICGYTVAMRKVFCIAATRQYQDLQIRTSLSLPLSLYDRLFEKSIISHKIATSMRLPGQRKRNKLDRNTLLGHPST